MSFQTDLYDSMVADTMDLTKRPDLEAETRIAVRSATGNAHLSGAYVRDTATQLVRFPNAAYTVAIDITTMFPRMRGISSVNLADATDAIMQDPKIEIVELGDIRDPDYGYLRNNIAYLAGTALNIRSTNSMVAAIVQYLQMPETRREGYNSWIAQLYPDVITFWAASMVLTSSGKLDKANKYMERVNNEFLPFLQQNFLIGALR